MFSIPAASNKLKRCLLREGGRKEGWRREKRWTDGGTEGAEVEGAGTREQRWREEGRRDRTEGDGGRRDGESRGGGRRDGGTREGEKGKRMEGARKGAGGTDAAALH